MASSGTVGNTVINTTRLLEKALRRCGLTPQVITPEIVSNAKEDLFMLIMSLSNRGLNLWCIDSKLLPMTGGKSLYVLPTGTTDVLNLMHCTPLQLDVTQQYPITNGYVFVDFTTPTNITNLGLKFTVNPVEDFKFQGSNDALTWSDILSISVSNLQSVNTYNWFDMPVQPTYRYYRIWSTNFNAVASPVTMSFSNTVREIMITPFNRDDYAAQPNKTFQSGTVTNYWFEKLVTPQITLWPVPSDDTRFLRLYRYRQVQDVGDITDELEIPLRWYEAITWHLASRLAFELPGIEPDRRREVVQMAGTMTIEVEGGETDSSPTFFAPNIRVYTR